MSEPLGYREDKIPFCMKCIDAKHSAERARGESPYITWEITFEESHDYPACSVCGRVLRDESKVTKTNRYHGTKGYVDRGTDANGDTVFLAYVEDSLVGYTYNRLYAAKLVNGRS